MQEQKTNNQKVFTLENGFTLNWEDLEFLKYIRELKYGEIEKMQVVNGRVQSFKKIKESVKIF